MKKDTDKISIIGMISACVLAVLMLCVRMLTKESVNWFSAQMFIPRVVYKTQILVFLAFLFRFNLIRLKKSVVFGAIPSFKLAQTVICLLTLVIGEAEIIRNEVQTPTHNNALIAVIACGMAFYSVAVIWENRRLRDFKLISNNTLPFLIICLLAAAASIVNIIYTIASVGT